MSSQTCCPCGWPRENKKETITRVCLSNKKRPVHDGHVVSSKTMLTAVKSHQHVLQRDQTTTNLALGFQTPRLLRVIIDRDQQK